MTFLVLLSTMIASCNGGGGSGSEQENTGTKRISLKLNWTPPSERADGSRLYPYEIGGYEILYRKNSSPDWNSIVIYDDQSWVLDKYEIKDLSTGTYEIKMATFDIDGRFSTYSDPVKVDKY
ncbi:fibronectin type III domain-containing protein [Halobacteriovorax sp.]|uniref:fibronectin type III domain-containing protein n=1 Tax=Halobacteriovorax sp. TaxID=2020862 RepID=UPI003AF2BC23